MKFVSDVQKLLDEYKIRIDDSLEKYKNGENTPESNRAFNALMYHLEDVCISLQRGLDGEF